MISYHPWAKIASHCQSGFKTADRIGHSFTKHAWSGCVWDNGRRLEECFLYSDWCILDFDDGEMTLAEATKTFCDCIHAIGTTRSHQKDKLGVVCDRFRVAIPWAERITDLHTFRHNMIVLRKSFPLDKKCHDGARFYFPCIAVTSMSAEGYTQEVLEAPPPKVYEPRPPGVVPLSAMLCFQRAVRPGERNQTFYKATKDLYRAGKSADEILHAIFSSPTYIGQIDPLLIREIESTVSSAIKSVNAESC